MGEGRVLKIKEEWGNTTPVGVTHTSLNKQQTVNLAEIHNTWNSFYIILLIVNITKGGC